MTWLGIALQVFTVLASIVSLILSIQANRMSRKAESLARRGS